MAKKSDEAKVDKADKVEESSEATPGASLLPPDVAGDIEAAAEGEAAAETTKDATKEAPPQRKTDPGMTVVVPSEPPAMPEAKRGDTRPSDGSIESPTFMPGPDEVPDGSPGDPSTVPGHVPPGDSRSLRRGLEFSLVYRVGSAVISRFGVVGTRGQWRVVEYPTSASASNAYAKECSRFVADGFSDYRD